MGKGREGTEGNGASAFPVHLGTGEAVGLPDLILCPWGLPPAAQSPSPAPTPPHKALPLYLETASENPSYSAGPKPHPHTLTLGLTSKLPNSTLQRQPFGPAASTSGRVLSRGPAPRLNIVPSRPRPKGPFRLDGS